MTTWWNGVETYYNWPRLPLPFRCPKTSLEIEEIAVKCSDCGRPTACVRGEVKEYGNCAEFRCAGLCDDCKLVTYARGRVYQDGHILWEGPHGWFELEAKRSFWGRAADFVHNLLARGRDKE